MSISGQVLNDVTGTPVARVLVRFNDRAVLTDHEGKFQIDQITDVAGNLQLIKPGFYMTQDQSDIPNRLFQTDQITSPLEFRLYPEAILTGTVVAPDGEPLPRINVQVRRSYFDDASHRWIQAGQTQSDLHGNYRLPLPAGDYRVETRYVVQNDGTQTAVLPLSLPAAGTGAVGQAIHLRSGEEEHLDLHPTVRHIYPVPLSMEASMERGFPFISVRGSDGLSFNVGAIPGQTPGHATIQLPAGTYKLSARMQNQEDVKIAETTVTVTPGPAPPPDGIGTVLHFVSTPSIPVELAIESTATSDNNTGALSPSSRYIAPTRSYAQPSPQQFALLLQRIDPEVDDVTATIPLTTLPNNLPVFNAPPGTYRLISRGATEWFVWSASSGTSDLLSQPLIITNGVAPAPIRLLVSNQSGSLQGIVLANGVPAQCWVYLLSTSPSANPVISLRSTTDGTYSRFNVPPGSYQVIAFEHRSSSDLSNPAQLTSLSPFSKNITITAGNSSTLNLEAAPEKAEKR